MIYKAMRLEALQKEAGMFGLFHNNELIGITGIVIDKEQPDLGYLIQ
jgi:hypothetical protein